jgi:hypothetical protein
MSVSPIKLGKPNELFTHINCGIVADLVLEFTVHLVHQESGESLGKVSQKLAITTHNRPTHMHDDIWRDDMRQQLVQLAADQLEPGNQLERHQHK